MAKSPAPQSAERAHLAAAHADLTTAQAHLAEAEAAFEQAQRAYGRARYAVGEIEDRIDALKNTRHYGVAQLIADKSDKIAEARAAREAATQAAYPFGVDEEQAQARVTQAQYAVNGAEMRLARAAASVLVNEVEPIARGHFERCKEAFSILLEHAPSLLTMIDKDLLTLEFSREVEGAADNLLRRASAWREIEVRCRNSPWRAAQQLLEQDPQAILPAAAS
ncbi:MAG: hypothetical protein ACJ8AW_07750 [Rhodopila sp.]|jgi:hypothetical protein